MRESLSIGVVVGMQLLSQVLMQLLVIRIVGVGPETDAYNAALAIPTVLGAIVMTSMQSVWLPRFAVQSVDLQNWRSEQSIAQGQALLIGGGVFMVVGAAIAWLLPVLYSGFSPEQIEIATHFCFIFLVAFAFNTQSALLTVALRARGRFLLAEAIALIGTLVSLGAVHVAVPVWGLTAAAWIVLVRAIFVYCAQMAMANWPIPSLAKGWRFKETLGQMRPLMFGTSIYKTSPLVDRYWASQAPAGSITILNIAQMGISSLVTIFERAVCIPVTPSFSRLVAKNEYLALRKLYRLTLMKVTGIVIILGIGLLCLREQMILVISAVLNTDHDSSANLWVMCALLLGYLQAGISSTILTSAFYAMKQMAMPMKIGVLGFVISLGVKAIGFQNFQISGLVAAISIHGLLNELMLIVQLERAILRKMS